MALHIADPEVSEMVTRLAKMEGTTTTEALRRVLREVIDQRIKQEKRKGFRTAEYLNAPLLYKGNDFAQTPIRSVLTKAV